MDRFASQSMEFQLMTFVRFGHRLPSEAVCDYNSKKVTVLSFWSDSLADLYLFA